MVEPGIFWTHAGLGLLILILGASWVVQSKILSGTDEKKSRFNRRLLGSGYLIMAVGIAYVIFSLLLL